MTTKKSTGLAKKNATDAQKISPTEKQILDSQVARTNAAHRDFEEAKGALGNTLALIGDRYGVDLTRGAYNVSQDGTLVPTDAGQQAEQADAGAQLLNE
jgi:hypothetical protein